jgi:cytochrome c-type biogenesis protein CcmH
MTIWLFALLLTAIACATLFYAGAGRTVNAGPSAAEATRAHFRAQLGAIESDTAIGRLGPNEAAAAKSELAREVIRLTDDAPPAGGSRAAIGIAVALVAVLSVGTYWFLGRPDLPAAPLASRDVAAENSLDLGAAISTIEARLAQNPDDLRGWQVIAPAYVQLGRYDDAVRALRQVNKLAPTADTLTDLGEALMMRNGGSVVGEAIDSFKQAAALDPKHVRSRFYIAGEETRTGDYNAAVQDWNGLLALAEGSEPWVVTAKNGLAFAEAQLNPSAASAAPVAPDSTQIDAMVDGLDARLKSQGGTIDEWTRLVRSRLVQGKTADAQTAYEAARKVYPDASVRTELDVLAADSGLVAK